MKEESKLFAASSIQNNGSEYPLVRRRFRLHSMPLKISSWALRSTTERIDRVN